VGLRKTSEKLNTYFDRLKRGKASKIKPSHVEKAIAKLKAKQALLNEELAEAVKPSKRERLRKKLGTVQAQIERGEWLLAQINAEPSR